MYLDEIVSRARAACEDLLRRGRSRAGAVDRLSKALKSTAMAMVALSWAAAVDKHVTPSILLCSYRGSEEEALGGAKITQYYLLPNGEILRRVLLSCQSGCHEFGHGIVRVTPEEMLEDGARAEDIAKNLVGFLSDPNDDLLGFASGVRN